MHFSCKSGQTVILDLVMLDSTSDIKNINVIQLFTRVAIRLVSRVRAVFGI